MRYLHFILLITVVFLQMGRAMAIEEAKYSVVVKDDNIEVREYSPYVLAETLVEGDLEEAGNKAFNKLFQYISGNNKSRDKLAMTAPVSQESAGEKIDMTAPVGQKKQGEQWAVSFMMPASYTLETLPQPVDPAVTLREVPARRLAAIRYSGFWSKEGFLQNKAELVAWLEAKEYRPVGEAIWARYNAPYTLWFLRRNEVLIPIED